MEIEVKKYELEPATNIETTKVTFDLTSTKKSQIESAVERFSAFLDELERDSLVEVLPNDVASITTLKTPCGQGFKTWSRYKLVVHQRRFTLTSTHEQLEKIIQFLKNLSHVQINIGLFD